uniref:fluoride efflux transporter CrcB n=1 Tax=Alistipes sp. TaxID=1872444 RepID=UPI004055E2DA
MWKLMLWAGAGGFVGTCLRFLVGRYVQWIAPTTHFPWGTFIVNVVGSLLIGILYGLVERYNLLSPHLSALLITGLCGGLTTFSSFADDLYKLLLAHHWGVFVLYLSLSFTLGLVMVFLGRELVEGH